MFRAVNDRSSRLSGAVAVIAVTLGIVAALGATRAFDDVPADGSAVSDAGPGPAPGPCERSGDDGSVASHPMTVSQGVAVLLATPCFVRRPPALLRGDRDDHRSRIDRPPRPANRT